MVIFERLIFKNDTNNDRSEKNSWTFRHRGRGQGDKAVGQRIDQRHVQGCHWRQCAGLYQQGFEKLNVGYASAASIFMFIILFIFTSIQFKAAKGGAVE